MLIFDGRGSHLTQEFLDFCWQYRIRPFQLPSHTTYLLQPLDVGVFQSLKHKKEVRKQVFLGAKEISRTDFFAFFQWFHDKTFKNPRIYKSAFRKTGLIPLNPQLVLSKLKGYQALQRPKTPPLIQRSSPPLPSSSPGFTTPPPPADWARFQTPLTIRTRKPGFEYIRQRHHDSLEQGMPITPSVIRVAEKIEKAAETSILSGAF